MTETRRRSHWIALTAHSGQGAVERAFNYFTQVQGMSPDDVIPCGAISSSGIVYDAEAGGRWIPSQFFPGVPQEKIAEALRVLIREELRRGPSRQIEYSEPDDSFDPFVDQRQSERTGSWSITQLDADRLNDPWDRWLVLVDLDR